jgi:hypothetical protein
MSIIPTYMERFVGPGDMSDKTIVYDYPMLSMIMVNLQNDQTRGAADYSELKVMPKYMKHLVGNVKISKKEKTVVVCGKERRVRAPAQWVLYPLISDQVKITTVGGKRYAKRQVSTFIEKYFSPSKVDEDQVDPVAVKAKPRARLRIIDDDDEYLRI